MSDFKQMLDSPRGSKFVVQGNEAFALGVIHAGYHAADGYPGTPSTEVIDKYLSKVQDRIKVGWSVNEAVAVGVGIGYSISGFDVVVTMKTPGAFHAADVISTSAFYDSAAGALVIYVPTDYVPSSTQHVIDLRYFFASCRLPVFEPRSIQEFYEIPAIAADISRKFHTPVIILASGILAHSEALISVNTPRKVLPLELGANLYNWMRMPNLARNSYNNATQNRIPDIRFWAEDSDLVSETIEDTSIGIIVNGGSVGIIEEVIQFLNIKPSVLTISISNPLPIKKIKSFADKINGKLIIIEEGDRFIEEKLLNAGIKIIGKGEDSIITNWTTKMAIEFVSKQFGINFSQNEVKNKLVLPPRPPSICPGCPYKAFSISVDRLKKQKKLYAVFGDIGCSTLLYFLNSLDTVLCMGASDSMRQGFVMGRPEMAAKTISVIGDSTECHSGLDATRNAVFRNVAGVKVILDNNITAMTGGQPAPSSIMNLEGKSHLFNLKRAIEAEGGRTVEVDSYNLKNVEDALKIALQLSEEGVFTTLILKGPCIHSVSKEKKNRNLVIDRDACVKCGRCNICHGIIPDTENAPHFTDLCTNCAGEAQVCMQRCPHKAIVFGSESQNPMEFSMTENHAMEDTGQKPKCSKVILPESIRLAIRGIGGQGNLFFGKVLAELMLNTSYKNDFIIKGETHGMAVLGGSVISTFSCGKVKSQDLSPATADILIGMEASEVFRPDFLELLKPDGTIILNDYIVVPAGASKDEYPDLKMIENSLQDYKTVIINALDIAKKTGDITGKTMNMVILGYLSCIHPFNLIPENLWINAILSVSYNEKQGIKNTNSFKGGRNYDK